MQTRNPQNQIGKSIAAIPGALALGLLVVWQEVAATDPVAEDATAETETLPAGGFGVD